MPGRSTKDRRARARAYAAALLAVGALAGASPTSAQQRPAEATAPDTVEARPVPDDTYADAGVRDLITRARRERYARARGLTSFELTFRERIYAGLGGRIVRRERALFHQERAARVHWRADGDRVVQWLGVRRGVPIVGVGLEIDEENPRTDDAFDIDFDFLDPAEDRIFLGNDWALHPLADTAVYHYRYRSGDTLRIRFPGDDRTITLVEAIVEPREGRFDRIVGSLWFDRDQAVLARAAYRPAIPFDFEREEPEDSDEVPGFVKPIRATVEYITVDYGLQELRWWLPNRMAFDGTASVGGLATMPIRFEWTFEDYQTDLAESLDPGEDAVPEGWHRWVESDHAFYVDGEPYDLDELLELTPDELAERTAGFSEEDREHLDEELEDRRQELEEWRAEHGEEAPRPPRRTVMIVPPVQQLFAAPELPEPLFSGSVDAFDDSELDDLRSRLDELSVPDVELAPVSVLWGISPGIIRYNRVEGISPGGRVGWPTGVTSRFELSGRIGVPEFEPGVEARWLKESPTGSFGIGGYRRLTDLGDWGRPLGFGNSINSLLVGYDDGLYFRQTGGELFATHTAPRVRWEGRLFGELQQNAPKQTDVSLPAAWSDYVFPENVAADRGTVFGLGGRVRTFSGVDPEKAIVSATAWGEAGAGDFDYGRIAASTALTVPVGDWTGAVEVGAGTTFGNPSAQRLYYMGGHYTLRGFGPGSIGGEAFWLARAELGWGFRVGPNPYDMGGSAFRITAFGDAAWAGARDAFGTEGWKAGAGIGLSALDGLFRIDIARAVRGGDTWRVHIYADGLM